MEHVAAIDVVIDQENLSSSSADSMGFMMTGQVSKRNAEPGGSHGSMRSMNPGLYACEAAGEARVCRP